MHLTELFDKADFKIRLKKIILSVSVILVFTVYVSIMPKSEQTSASTIDDKNKIATDPTSQTGFYKNGEYTGSVADAYYGNVQIKLVVDSGKITNVQFLDYPHDRQTSLRINNYAMPRLISEVIQAQNAPVDAVSGATATSMAFNESLASAISEARI